MKKAWFKLAFGIMACTFLIGYGIALAQDQTQQQEMPPAAQPEAGNTSPDSMAGGLPEPLQAEMTVAEHWTKNTAYPRTIAAGARVHVVEKGDTLWDLAQRYYNNPLLWPQIWEANNYIPNAHWIYPGDPVVIPPLSPVTEQQIAEETTSEPSTGEGESAPPGPIVPAGKQSFPIAVDYDLYCSGYISSDIDNVTLKILAAERRLQVTQSLFDIVYLNQGEAEGISPGDEFTILKKIRNLDHPVTLRPLGEYVIQTGRLKVVATQEHTATAQLTYSCDASLIDSYLVPFEPKEIPMLSDLPPVDRFAPEGPNTKGYIVFAKDDLGSIGMNNEVEIDLGSKDGVAPGTRLVVYRDYEKTYEMTNYKEDLPRRVLGEVVLFNVQDSTSTGRIIQSYDFMTNGDRVEVR